MNIKRLVQFFLIFIIILISYLFYKNYFYEEQNVKVDTEIQNIEENILSSEKTSNIIENFEYEANDKDGNSYIVKAEKAEIQKDYTEILILTNVRSIIYIENRKEILIFSDFAEFNKENYDTKFSDNVKILYDKIKIMSDNVDIFFKDNKAIVYNNIKYKSLSSELNADIINFDLITGNIKINMYDEHNNVQIKKSVNGNN